MLTDNFQDIGTTTYRSLILRAGASFPANPKVGLLFSHNTHGVCVFCHDSSWRKVSR